jgi:hypothetical protein
VGSPEQPYGRFARGFEHATGRDRLDFRFEDGFFADAANDAPRQVRLRVVYYDGGNGEWALRYDAMDNSDKTAKVVRKTDSGRWKELIVDIADARFEGAREQSADVSLVNTDTENDIFHMIEVIRAGDR